MKTLWVSCDSEKPAEICFDFGVRASAFLYRGEDVKINIGLFDGEEVPVFTGAKVEWKIVSDAGTEIFAGSGVDALTPSICTPRQLRELTSATCFIEINDGETDALVAGGYTLVVVLLSSGLTRKVYKCATLKVLYAPNGGSIQPAPAPP